MVGTKYDKGELFLPQMIQAAETVKVSLNIIKERLSKNNNTSSKGKIIVATVQGDIHDIGKITKRLNVIDKSIIVILNKLTKGKLKSIKTSKKIQCYYNHSNYGYEILKDIIDDTVILDIVKNHHSDNGNNLVNFFKQIDDKN